MISLRTSVGRLTCMKLLRMLLSLSSITQLISARCSLSLQCLLDAEETVKVSSSDLPLGLSHVRECDHQTAPARHVPTTCLQRLWGLA